MLDRFRGFLLLVLLSFVLCMASCGGSNDGRSARPAVPPVNVRVDQGAEGLYISWAPVAGASHYVIFWSSEPGQYSNCARTNTNAAIITGPTKGELYAFAVTSWNARGESGYSKEVLFVCDDDEHAAPRYLSKARELISAGQFQEAHAYLSAAIRLQPAKAEGYQLRASLYEQMQQPDLAKDDHAVAKKLVSRKTAALQDPRPVTQTKR